MFKFTALLTITLAEAQNTATGGFPCRSKAGCGSLYPDYQTPKPPPPQLRPVDPACPQCPYQTLSDQGYFPNTPSPAPQPRYYAPTVKPTPTPTDVGDYTAPYVDRNPPPTPLPSGATPTPPIAIICMDTCAFARNGECEDGGPATTTARCRYGEDCADCGARQVGGTLDQNGGNVGAPLVTTPPTPTLFSTPTPPVRTLTPFATQTPGVGVPYTPDFATPRPFYTTKPTPVPTAANWQGWNQYTQTPQPLVSPNTIPPRPNAAVPLPTNAAGNPIAATPIPTPTPPSSPVVPVSRVLSPEPTPPPVVAAPDNGGDSDNKMAFIIALAVVAALLIIGLVAFCCYKRSKKNKQKKQTDAQLQQISSTGSSFGSPYDAAAPGYTAPPQFTYGDALEMSPSNTNNQHFYY